MIMMRDDPAQPDTGTPSGERAHAGMKGASRPAFPPLRTHLQAVDHFLNAQELEFESEIRSMVRYCLGRTGKRIRAALVFLSGWREHASGLPSHEAVQMAAVIEMVHLATLVHDDIMDAAEIRRNQLAAGVKFGIDRSVLLGDAMFAQALNLAAQFPEGSVCRRVSKAVRLVCSGEIMQTLKGDNDVPDIQGYYRIITLKTAELFRAACELGAQTGGYPETFCAAAGRFGCHLGVAYQIYDDLLDYFGEESQAGKTLGSDFRSGKFTLPLIILLERLDPGERQELMKVFGRKGASLSRWVARMDSAGVYDAVHSAIVKEMALASQALDGFADIAAAAMLRRAMILLEGKVAALRP